VATQTPLHCYSTLSNTTSKPVVELHGGLRGSGAPERPGGPRETSEGTRGSVKGPHEITHQSMIATNIIILSTDADAFCSRNVTSGGLEGASAKKKLGSLSLAIFYDPLVNYAVFRPLYWGQ